MKRLFCLISFFAVFCNYANSSSNNENSLAFISQIVKPGSLVFDIGAHIGNKTRLYRACGAQVICLEPQPFCCNKLEEAFKDDPFVTIIPKGVAANPGILQLSICSQASTISTFSTRWKEDSRFSNAFIWDKVIEVEVTTLDELIAIYGLPDFCKVDVENYEYEVLLGLHSPIPYISFETAFEVFDNSILCIKHLELLGYRSFNFAFGEDPRLLSDVWLSGEAVISLIKTMGITDPVVWGDIYAHFE